MTPAPVSIGLSPAATTAECVFFHTVNGTATGATTIGAHDGTQDYVSKSGSVKLAAGTTTGAISSSVNYDDVPEANETYTVVVTKVALPGAAERVHEQCGQGSEGGNRNWHGNDHDHQ